MDVGLQKAPLLIFLLSTFRVSSINYYLVCIVYRFTKYALCAVYLARFLCYSRRKTSMTLKSGIQMG